LRQYKDVVKTPVRSLNMEFEKKKKTCKLSKKWSCCICISISDPWFTDSDTEDEARLTFVN